MKIIIDCRENSLIQNLNFLLDDNSIIKTENMDIGDIKIVDDNNSILVLFERKTVNDLASSILDGRYNEQSYRLNISNIHNHNIFYIIEGDMNSINKKCKINTKTLYSSLTTLSYYKGFSIFKTNNINETAIFILRIFEKIKKENKRESFYKNKSKTNDSNANDSNANDSNTDDSNTNDSNTDDSNTNDSNANNSNANNSNANDSNANDSNANDSNASEYTGVIKTIKKNNITRENISIIMLMQIPNISSKIATIIINKYKNIYNLLEELNKNNNCLDGLSYNTGIENKTRKISKTAIENLKKYLL